VTSKPLIKNQIEKVLKACSWTSEINEVTQQHVPKLWPKKEDEILACN